MLAKNWDKAMEDPLSASWRATQRYAFSEASKPVYSIDTPPPYVNAPIHIGHAATYVHMDFFARFHRMTGHSVIFPLGLDRNGLPIEMAAEKKFNVSIHKTSREQFLALCKQMLEEFSMSSIDSFARLGISFNSWKIGHEVGDMYLTDSNDYRAMTQATFIDLWNKGLIYEDLRVNNYCPGCRTTLADAEIDYEDISTGFNDVAFTVKETGDQIVIGTTRPELIATCAMIIYNPADDRYRHLEGKTAITPIFDKHVPIKAHPFADLEKGTGLVMMCSFGDQTDIRFFREQGLTPVIAINEDGTMNQHAGFLAGMKVKEARDAMLKKLQTDGLLLGQKHISHRTPICERSKHAVEFIEMKEFYLKQIDFKDAMRRIAHETNFYDEKSRLILLDWIETVSIDWPLSRRRYYGTEIPLWYCTCGKIIPGPRGKYVQPWREKPPRPCPECGAVDMRGDDRILDTWFDSSSSPFYILKWLDDPERFARRLPASLRPQGKEIIRTWLYYTLLKTYLLTGEPAFRDVWINYHILDAKGTKMSKRLGNVIDPHEIITRFGAEPFRLWCAVEGNLHSSDLKCSYDRIEGAGKTLAKLWNVAKFIETLGPPHPGHAELLETDKWILHEFDQLIASARSSYEHYDFHTPTTALKHFLWETFSSHYLELVKNRAYNQEGRFTTPEQNGALQTLNTVLQTLLKLLAPVVPFITATLYQELYAQDIHAEQFPPPAKPPKTSITTSDITELNSTIWKVKKDNSLSLKSPIRALTLPEKFRPLEKDIKAAHGAREVSYDNFIEVVISE